MTRREIEDAIELLIGALDAMDGDADCEPELDEPEDDSESQYATPWGDIDWQSADLFGGVAA
jgi:hypothetical protein